MFVQRMELGDRDTEVINNSSVKAPNSFLLYKTKRRNEHGQQVSSLQLLHEWKNLSNEQKTEFQNQSQCIQFTLDIDNRRPSSIVNTKRLPKIVVPPPSSMVIPNDHASPTTTDLLYNHHPHPQQHHYQPHHYQHSHHQLSDLLLIPSPTPTHSHEKTYFYSTKNDTNYVSYTAAAEAAALESFNHESTKQDKSLQSLKKKYGTLPEKVKRPPNAYLLFNRDMRRQLKHVNQGLTSGEISKSISSKWKQLSSSERDYYIQEEIKLKQLHNKQHTNFIYTRRSKAEMREADSLKKSQKSNFLTLQQQQQLPKKKLKVSTAPVTIGRDPRGRKKKKLDASLPKHPMSGYLHFAKKMRPIMKEKCPDARLVEISKLIGSQWRSMSEKELQPWQDIANKDKQRYAREMKDRMMNKKLDEDISSVSSTCSSINTFQYKRKFSSSNSSITDNNDTLDSHTIAAVAQMVNRNNSSHSY